MPTRPGPCDRRHRSSGRRRRWCRCRARRRTASARGSPRAGRRHHVPHLSYTPRPVDGGIAPGRAAAAPPGPSRGAASERSRWRGPAQSRHGPSTPDGNPPPGPVARGRRTHRRHSSAFGLVGGSRLHLGDAVVGLLNDLDQMSAVKSYRAPSLRTHLGVHRWSVPDRLVPPVLAWAVPHRLPQIAVADEAVAHLRRPGSIARGSLGLRGISRGPLPSPARAVTWTGVVLVESMMLAVSRDADRRVRPLARRRRGPRGNHPTDPPIGGRHGRRCRRGPR